MENRFLTARRLFVAGGCAFLLLVGLVGEGVLILRMHKETNLARTYARIFPLPAARVGHTWVLYREYLRHVDAQATFLKGPAAQALGYPAELTNELREQALDRAMRIAAVEGEGASAGLQVTALDVDRSYESLIQREGASSTPEEIRSFLRDQFGWDEADFKTYVVRPAMLEDALRQKKGTAGGVADTVDKLLQARMTNPTTKRFVQF